MSIGHWEATLDRILELTVLLHQDMTRSLAGYGLTDSRAHLVWELHHRGPCTQQALASALKVTPRTITALVDGLAETGFVVRQPHPADRRATLVTFTGKGRLTAETLASSHRELARQLFSGLPGETFDGFSAGLNQVVDRLRALIDSKDYTVSPPGDSSGRSRASTPARRPSPPRRR
jgi:DNA-binding MarR family transcriptional regulator